MKIFSKNGMSRSKEKARQMQFGNSEVVCVMFVDVQLQKKDGTFHTVEK